MYPRVEYEMSEEDHQKILSACVPTPVMKIGSYTGSTPQQNANMAWKRLGEKMGFEWETVRPIAGKGQRFFTAIPSETASQREERLMREANEKRATRIDELQKIINKAQDELDELKSQG